MVGLEDLLLAFSQRLDLGGFAEPAAFRAAGNLNKISGSGFEEIRIRISQSESSRVFSEFMINRWQISDQIDDHNRGAGRHIQKLLGVGFETKIRILRMEAAAGRRMDSDLHDDQRRSE